MLKPEEQEVSACLLMAEVKIAQGKPVAHRVALFIPACWITHTLDWLKKKNEQICSMSSLHLK